jgi:hypothetical protein
VLNRCCWSALAAAQILFLTLIDRFAGSGPVVIGMDDTIERRWGAKIKARGIYRDPGRSSHGHFVKASGLRWLSTMLPVPVPWSGRVWALPFLTVLVPSERSAAERGVRHKTLIDGARQMLLQIARWLPDRRPFCAPIRKPDWTRSSPGSSDVGPSRSVDRLRKVVLPHIGC